MGKKDCTRQNKKTNMPKSFDNEHFLLLFRFFMTIVVFFIYVVFFETKLPKISTLFFQILNLLLALYEYKY